MIVQKDDPVLRMIARPVVVSDIKTKKIQAIILQMKKNLSHENDGVALAAPQIGESLRIFIVSGRVFDPDYLSEHKVKKMASALHPDLVFINPEIIKRSRQKKWLPEGCLSVRWIYGETHRHTQVTLEGYDEMGKKVTRGASGLLSQIFQHELDHLNGMLFIDHARLLKEEKPNHEDKQKT